ncbi:MAG TPA: hypothetical protein VJH63_03835 [Candidatus Paceibacterota bacterium]
MSEVQFEENQNPFTPNRNVNVNTESRMINFLIKKGIVKSADQALKVLLSVAFVLIALSVYFFWSNYKKTVISPDDPRFKYSEEQMVNFPPEIQERIRNNRKVK